MVQNLNILSFAPYGRLLPDDTSWAAGAERITVKTDDVGLFCADGPVYLDYEAGMSLLAIADGAQYRYFYLDKPVCLHPGVIFSVLPYQAECTVKISGPRHPAKPGQLPQQSPALCRRIQVGRVYTFFYQEKERGFFFRGERHPMLELTYVDKGSLHSVAGGHELLLGQGDMTIYSPNQWHMQYADADCAPSFITVTFDLEGETLEPLFHRRFRTPQRAVQLLQVMLAERDRQDAYTADMLILLLGQLLITVLREAEREKPLQTANAVHAERDTVGAAQQFISAHIRQKLSVPMVAHAAGVSPSYLAGLFQRRLQISPGEYIRRAKLQESKLLIREGTMNFTQIAETLQYSTVHHFSRQFKEKFGITPTEYARSIRP